MLEMVQAVLKCVACINSTFFGVQILMTGDKIFVAPADTDDRASEKWENSTASE